MKKILRNLNVLLLIFVSLCSVVTMFFAIRINTMVQSMELEEPYVVLSPSINVSTESTTQIQLTSSTEENSDAFVVDTPYVHIVFPKDYAEKLHCVESTEAECYSNTFYCILSDSEVELFTVHFNRAFEGELFGYLSENGHRIPFTISFPEEQGGENWTEEERFTVRAMQEAVNFVIDSVVTDPRYISD